MIGQAYKELVGKDVKFNLVGTTIDGVVWLDSRPQPDKATVEAKMAELEKIHEYQSKRAAEYPPLQDQLDMQYWDSVNGTTTWKDLITKIKSDNPKPS